jgi:hypothetical protein
MAESNIVFGTGKMDKEDAKLVVTGRAKLKLSEST